MNKKFFSILIILFSFSISTSTAFATTPNLGGNYGWQETIITTNDPYPWSDIYMMEIGDADNDSLNSLYIGTEQNFYAPKIMRYFLDNGVWNNELFVSASSSFNAIAGMAIGDVDNDGLNEFVYGLHKQGNTKNGPLLVREWTGTNWITSTIFNGIGDWSWAYDIADPDNDGKNEIVSSVSTYVSGVKAMEPWLFEYENGSWVHESLSDNRNGTNPDLTNVGDVDGDGVVEMIRLRDLQSSSAYYREYYSVIDYDGGWNEIDILPPPAYSFGTLGRNYTRPASVGDPDGDGKDELVFAYWQDTDHDSKREAGDDSVVILLVENNGTS
jgi:hypothetical protein